MEWKKGEEKKDGMEEKGTTLQGSCIHVVCSFTFLVSFSCAFHFVSFHILFTIIFYSPFF